MISPDAIYEALDQLRSDADRTDAEERWRTVMQFLRETYPGSNEDDARQETFLSIVRAVSSMDARTPRQALKWISVIHRRKRIDGIRASKNDPARPAARRADEDEDPLHGIAAPLPALEGGSEQLEDLLSAIEAEVEAILESQPPARKHLGRVQARACLRRAIWDESYEEIVRALCLPTAPSRDQLYKWIERGRPLVLAAVDHWEQHAEADFAEVVATALREVVGARRVDAGKPRSRSSKSNE